MRIIWTENAWQDYQYWFKQNDKKVLKRIHLLINDIERTPFEGLGKPEPLKYDFSGWWSRKITSEHRLIYKIQSDDIIIAGLRYHYE